jgi:hypothetical protein
MKNITFKTNRWVVYIILLLIATALFEVAGHRLSDFLINLSASLVAVIIIAELYERRIAAERRNAQLLARGYALADLDIAMKDLHFALSGLIGLDARGLPISDYVSVTKLKPILSKAEPLGFFVNRFWTHYLMQIDDALEKPLAVKMLDDSDVRLLIQLRNKIKKVLAILGTGSIPMLIEDSQYTSKLIGTVGTTSNIAGYQAQGIGDIKTHTVNNAASRYTLGTARFMGGSDGHLLNRYKFTEIQQNQLLAVLPGLFTDLHNCHKAISGTEEFPTNWLEVINFESRE